MRSLKCSKLFLNNSHCCSYSYGIVSLIIITFISVVSSFLIYYGYVGEIMKRSNFLIINGNYTEIGPYWRNYWPMNPDFTKEKRFKILFWTNWYGDKSPDVSFSFPECANDFIITISKSEVANVDVIVFSFVDIMRERENFAFPPSRNESIPWILASQEASIHYPPFTVNGQNLDGLFNWTWSFRSDSLIHPNFKENFELYKEEDSKWNYSSAFSQEMMRNKTKQVAWVVSNCWMQPSRRNEIFDSLKSLGIQIDKYGKCGDKTCEDGEKCFEQLGKTYKFYLSFENALCEDYITEKIYHGLLHNMIPIVYAMGKVEKMHAPLKGSKSFINVMDFSSIAELADRIKHLDKNPEEYFKYLEWRKYYNISTNTYRNKCHNWIKMRQYKSAFLSGENKYKHVYDKFDLWYLKFYNSDLNRTCETCIKSNLINITHPNQNNLLMYGSPNRCLNGSDTTAFSY